MTTQTNNAVDANAVESGVLKLWQEFLARYFDAGQHDVGAVADVQFPQAEPHFQQSAVTQPLDAVPASGAQPGPGTQPGPGISITLVWSAANRRKWTAWENVETSPIPSGGSPDGTGGSPVLPRTRQELCYERVN